MAWQLETGDLRGRNLQVDRFQQTWTEAAGAGLIVGVGTCKGKFGRYPPDSGLVWQEAGGVTAIIGEE